MPRALGKMRVVGWQTALADLSMILFLVSASAYVPALNSSEPSAATEEPSPAQAKRADPPPPDEGTAQKQPALGTAAAIFRPGMGKSLEDWLARQNPDPRKQLTITAFFPPGTSEQAADQAIALAAEAGSFPGSVRIVLEPAQRPGLMASLAYDRADDQARAATSPASNSGTQLASPNINRPV